MNTTVRNIILVLAISFIFVAGFVIYSQNKEIQAKKTPESPSSLSVSRITSKEIELSWKDEATNEAGYRIYRNGEKIAERPINTEVFVDYNIKPSTEYEYAVVAYNKNSVESTKAVIITKSKNPALAIRLQKIAITENCEDEIWNPFSPMGELYLGVIVSDGKNMQARRLPADKYYLVQDNAEIILNELIFYTPSVGEHIEIHLIGLEHDFLGLGDDWLVEAINSVIMDSLGPIPSLICTVAKVDFKTPITEIGGFRDDFFGEYNNFWPASDNWGVQEASYFYECDKGNGVPGLKIWFNIMSY